MKAVGLLAAINAFAWGSLAILGASLIRGVADQKVVGYPAPEQITYYLYVPIAACLMALALWLLSRRGTLRRIAFGIQLITLVALAPYMLFFTGGV